MYLVAPYLTDRMPLPHADREAMARFKLHMMMARLRSAVRYFLTKANKQDNDQWGRRLVEEVVRGFPSFHDHYATTYQEQIVHHIGYCAIYGFRIDVPYLVQDMTDMSYTGFPPDDADMSLPASVNATYMQSNDDEILSYTSDESYWWLSEDKI